MQYLYSFDVFIYAFRALPSHLRAPGDRGSCQSACVIVNPAYAERAKDRWVHWPTQCSLFEKERRYKSCRPVAHTVYTEMYATPLPVALHFDKQPRFTFVHNMHAANAKILVVLLWSLRSLAGASWPAEQKPINKVCLCVCASVCSFLCIVWPHGLARH